MVAINNLDRNERIVYPTVIKDGWAIIFMSIKIMHSLAVVTIER